MHHEVITEVREKTPTPMLKKYEMKALAADGLDQTKDSMLKKASKISSSGKK